MRKITLTDTRGMFLEDYDDRSESYTAYSENALKFSTLAQACRVEKEINQSYGFKKVQVTFT